MSTAILRRELLAADPNAVANGLRRVVRHCGSDSVHEKRPTDFAERKAALADLEPRILELSRHEDETLRELAADALGAWLGEPAMNRLLELALDPIERVRASAVGALEGWPDDPRALETLLHAGLAPTWTVRMRAARALAKFPGSEVEDVLFEALVDPDGFVRTGAGEALKKRDPATYIERLRKMADYPDPHMLDAAMDLLGAIGNRDDMKWLDKAGSWLNLSQPSYVRAWARKAARQIRARKVT